MRSAERLSSAEISLEVRERGDVTPVDCVSREWIDMELL
jgi:hypothetical protein